MPTFTGSAVNNPAPTALTTAQIVRSRIHDLFRVDNEIVIGDGYSSAFKLKQGQPHSNISGGSFTASIATNAGYSATGYSQIDITGGFVSFANVISANSAIRMDYQWAVFSEAEIGYFTGLGGIADAALGAVNHLLSDYARRGSWAAPDGSTYNDTQALNSLMQMRSALIAEIRGAEIGPVGYGWAWSEEQENY